MATFEIDNRTPYAVQPLILADGEGANCLVVVVKSTWTLHGARLAVADEQAAVETSGKHLGEPGESSVLYEPDVAMSKPATDVVMVGHAIAPHKDTTEMDVSLRVGPLKKTVRVFGDRIWAATMGIRRMTRPLRFESIPLVWERAYGGWDRSGDDPTRHAFDERNPVGSGYVGKHGRPAEGHRLPNLELPTALIREPEDRPEPAGFGFIASHWLPRRAYGGTYDDSWRNERSPLLPLDFDPRFHNAAAPGLVSAGYLRGNEPVEIVGATSGARMAFELPGAPNPVVVPMLRRRTVQPQTTVLDTVVIDADAQRVFMVWRTGFQLREGPHEVGVIRIDGAHPAAGTNAGARTGG